MKKQIVMLMLSMNLSLCLLLSGCGSTASNSSPAPNNSPADSAMPEAQGSQTGETSAGNEAGVQKDKASDATASSGTDSGISSTAASKSLSKTPSEALSKKHPEKESKSETPQTEPNAQKSETPQTEPNGQTSKTVAQGGPYGEISISLPAGWNFEACPIDSGKLLNGLYGIHFYPKGAAEGYIELSYTDSFGVCGTGLESKETTIAKVPASVGAYDGHEYWDFISFKGSKEGLVALTYSVDNWWNAYRSKITEILDTAAFNRDKKEGAAYIYSAESEAGEIGLTFSLKNISPTGATLVFRQYDPDAPTGELMYGDDFKIEKLQNGKWAESPIVVEGDYGFHDIAYTIPTAKDCEKQLDWKWLYGQLEPGQYRIKKTVSDFRKSGDYDDYTIFASFVIN